MSQTQTNFIFRNVLVEYNTDGTPTGVIVVDGKRFTLSVSTNLEALGVVPQTSGKMLVARQLLVLSGFEPLTVGQTASLEEQDSKFDSVTF